MSFRSSSCILVYETMRIRGGVMKLVRCATPDRVYTETKIICA
ncbi:UNVERIFIED_ORG: hypothetical protein QOE_2249 [Clostridioides difficile F501]